MRALMRRGGATPARGGFRFTDGTLPDGPAEPWLLVLDRDDLPLTFGPVDRTRVSWEVRNGQPGIALPTVDTTVDHDGIIGDTAILVLVDPRHRTYQRVGRLDLSVPQPVVEAGWTVRFPDLWLRFTQPFG